MHVMEVQSKVDVEGRVKATSKQMKISASGGLELKASVSEAEPGCVPVMDWLILKIIVNYQ
jgi:hypothetical protein